MSATEQTTEKRFPLVLLTGAGAVWHLNYPTARGMWDGLKVLFGQVSAPAGWDSEAPAGRRNDRPSWPDAKQGWAQFHEAAGENFEHLLDSARGAQQGGDRDDRRYGEALEDAVMTYVAAILSRDPQARPGVRFPETMRGDRRLMPLAHFFFYLTEHMQPRADAPLPVVPLFTTNYDPTYDALAEFCGWSDLNCDRRLTESMRVHTPTRPARYTPRLIDPRDPNAPYAGEDRTPVVEVNYLQGHLSWWRDDAGQDVRSFWGPERPPGLSRAWLPPGTDKLPVYTSHFDPHDWLRAAVTDASVLAVIGQGLRDRNLFGFIQAAARRNQDLRIVVIDPFDPGTGLMEEAFGPAYGQGRVLWVPAPFTPCLFPLMAQALWRRAAGGDDRELAEGCWHQVAALLDDSCVALSAAQPAPLSPAEQHIGNYAVVHALPHQVTATAYAEVILEPIFEGKYARGICFRRWGSDGVWLAVGAELGDPETHRLVLRQLDPDDPRGVNDLADYWAFPGTPPWASEPDLGDHQFRTSPFRLLMSIVGERVTVAALWPEGYVTGVLSADLGDRLTGELEVGVFFWGETPESHIGDLRIAGSI